MKAGWPPYLPLPGPPPVVLGATPGSGSGGRGSGGQSVDTSARRHRRMSASSTGIHLMPAFNAAAGDGDGGSWAFSSSSSAGVDLGPDASQPRYCYNRHRVYPEFPAMSNMGRLLFHGSALGSRTTDDDVLVMDGVLVANSSSPGPRRYSSFNDLGFVHAGSLGSAGSGRYGSNRQCSYGKEESRAVQPMNQRHSEVELQNGRPVQGAGVNLQAGRRTYHPLHPQSLSAAGLPTPAAIRPPAALCFTPPRATTTTPPPARTPAGSSWPPKRPEFKAPAVRGTSFTWPPTEEEDAFISQYLYGLRRTPLRRLPVFASICPV